MHRRAFLSLLFAGAGCAVVVSSAKAQTIATVLADTPTDVPATDFSSKGGHGGGRGHGHGGGFPPGWSRGRKVGWRGRSCPPGLAKKGWC